MVSGTLCFVLTYYLETICKDMKTCVINVRVQLLLKKHASTELLSF